MISKSRKVIMVVLLVIIVTAVVSWPSILRFIAQNGLQQARKNGTNISWDGLTTGFSSIALDNVTIWVPGPRVNGPLTIPVSLELTRLSVALDVPSLASLSPSVTFSTQLYGGSVTGDAQQSAGASRVNASLEDVELGKHRQLEALGVRGGLINGSVQDILITPQGPEGGTFSFQIRELRVPVLEAAKTLLRTDDLGTIDFDAEGAVSPTTINVPSIRLSSIFGSVVGSLTASDHLSRTPTLKGSFDVSLSENGATTFGPWLPLIPGAGLDSSTSAFLISVSNTPCSAGRTPGTTLRLTSGCLKLVFNKR